MFSKTPVAVAVFAVLLSAGVVRADDIGALVKIPAASNGSIDAILKTDGAHVWMKSDDFRKIEGINFSLVPSVDGQVDLAAIGNVIFDDAAAEATLEIDVKLLENHRISMNANPDFTAPTSPPLTAWLLNYDVQGQVSGGERTYSGIYDLSRPIFGGAIADLQVSQFGSIFQRQSASISKDFTENSTVLIAGDAVSRPGANGAPVRFSGLQFRRDSAINNQYLSAPSIAFTGTAATQSTLSVLIDNKLVSSRPVPPGPFDLAGVSAAIGSGGEVQVVVTDARGNQQIQTGTLFNSPGLLAVGLSDFAFSAGGMRTYSSTYDGAMASGFWRYGVKAYLTTELNAEASTETTTTAPLSHVGASVELGSALGNFGASARAGGGASGDVRYAWTRNIDNFFGEKTMLNVNASASLNSDEFRQIGGNGLALPKSERSIFAGIGRGPWRLTASAVLRPDTDLNSIMFSWNALKGPSFMASISRFSTVSNQHRIAENNIFVSISFPLDGSGFGIQSSTTSGPSGLNKSVSATYSGPSESALITVDSAASSTRYSGMGSYQAGAVDLSAQVSHTTFNSAGVAAPSMDAGRLNARGSVVFGESGVYASRSIGDGGYALVETGVANVVVKSLGNFSSKTDAKGNAVVPIRPYTKNTVNFDNELSPDSFDVSPLVAVAARHTGTRIKQATSELGVGVMVQLPVSQGVFVVNGHRYSVTDRGAWVDDQPPGKYIGHIEGGSEPVEFEIK